MQKFLTKTDELNIKLLLMKKNLFTRLAFLASVFIFNHFGVDAHSVQLGYCYSCNGDLRIWVEHWHGNEDPNSTTMTLDVTIGGSTSQYTGVPSASIMDTPVGNLPGCTNPITIFASCPGDANTYNDWVAYDFNGMPTGVPISITVVSGNTVFTADGCGMFPASTGIIIITPPPTFPDILDCGGNGNSTNEIVLPPGTTWTNDNPAIGLPSSGNGNIPAFVPNYSSGTNVANITISNTCGTSNFSITLNPSPLANFIAPSIGSAPVCSGQPVSFSDLTSPGQGGTINSWNWDFGDGSPNVNTQNPVHTFPASPLTFNVTLSVTESSGCVDDTTITVTIAALPNVDFDLDSVCLGNNSNLQNLTTIDNSNGDYISNWTWDFGNTQGSTIQNPSLLYAATGQYTVNLTAVSNNGCSGSATHIAMIYANPVVDFTPTTVCLNYVTSFTDLSTVNAPSTLSTWNWNFGDGNTSSAQSPTHTYGTSGIFNASLTVTTNNNCALTITKPVQVFASPIASFTAVNACENLPIQFTNTSNPNGGIIQTCYWDINNDGITDYTNNSSQISHDYNGQDGHHDVTLIVETNAGCKDTVTQQITVYTLPQANFSATTVCENAATAFTDGSTIVPATDDAITTYFWDFGNGTNSNTQNPSVNYMSENIYQAELVVTTNHGCKDSITIPVTVYPLPQVDFSPTSVCLEDVTPFLNLSTVSNAHTSNSNVGYLWDFGDGTTTTQNNPNHTYTADGDFQATLTVTTNHGCVNQVVKTVTVHPVPQVSFNGINLAGCSPVCPTIASTTTINNPSSITSYTWTLSNGRTYYGDTLFDCYELFGGTDENYHVTLTAVSNEGCTRSHTENNYIQVYHNPVAGFYFTPNDPDVMNPNVDFTNTSMYANTYEWLVEDNPSSTQEHISVTFSYDTHAYEVYLIAKTDRGCVDTARQVVTVKDVVIYYVPNTFTPDGDEFNNEFKPVFASGFDPQSYTLTIFNRWGEVLFESHDTNVGWDGTYSDSLVKEGVYSWKISFKSLENDKKYTDQGHVNILK